MYQATKTYKGVEMKTRAFLTPALDAGKWSVLRPYRFDTGTHWVGVWVGPRVCLEVVA